MITDLDDVPLHKFAPNLEDDLPDQCRGCGQRQAAGCHAPAPPPAVLDPQAIRRLGALTVQDERSLAVDQFVEDQRVIYQQHSKEDLIEALCARDRQLALEGRQLADGRIGGRLLREFVRGVLSAADRKDPQRIEQVLQALGAEPADARQLKLHGQTLGALEDQVGVAEGLASGERKQR